MSAVTFSLKTLLILLFSHITLQQGVYNCDIARKILSRRYDINDYGYGHFFHGWADVQGQGATNDYCRIVGVGSGIHLSCALAGTFGQSEVNYNSAKVQFEVGYPDTWYMKDEDHDGRDDYCRCLGDDKSGYQVICTRAGLRGFYGSEEQGGSSRTFTPTGPIDCKTRKVRPEFGSVSGFPLKST